MLGLWRVLRSIHDVEARLKVGQGLVALPCAFPSACYSPRTELDPPVLHQDLPSKRAGGSTFNQPTGTGLRHRANGGLQLQCYRIRITLRALFWTYNLNQE